MQKNQSTAVLKGYCSQPTEVYSRVVGYFRPVQSWNAGKQAEFGDRKTYVVAQEENEK